MPRRGSTPCVCASRRGHSCPRVLLASPPRLRWRRHRPRAPPLSSCADQSAEATPRCGSPSGVCPSGDIHLRAQRTWLCRRVAEHLDLHRAAAAIAADDRRRALGERDQLGILRRGVRQRPPGPELLRDLRPFEAFVSHAVAEVQNNGSLWRDTAIFVTFDEGGGYYDSGYVQPVSFFSDGTRVPMVVISPYVKRGYISHTYTDHV